jgi:hypothetical protein
VLYGYSENDTARISAAVRAVESGRLNQRSDLELEPKDRNFGKIPFRNDSGEAVPAYAVMRVTSRATVDGRSIHVIGKPTTTFQRRYLVNGVLEVGIGKRGWGTWLWHADYVLYNSGSGTPAYGEGWGPKSGQWSLEKNYIGFFVEGGNTGSGAASRTNAMQVMPHFVIGKADAAIPEDDDGTVRVYSGPRGTEADTGQTIAGAWNKGPDIDDEGWVSVGWSGEEPYCAGMKCPA